MASILPNSIYRARTTCEEENPMWQRPFLHGAGAASSKEGYQIPPALRPCQFRRRGYEPGADPALGMRLDLFNETQKGKNKLLKKKNSTRFEREMRCFDREYAQKMERAGPQGVFEHLEKASRRRTESKKSRRKMDRRGGHQVQLWTDAIRAIVREYPIDGCDFSPIEDYIFIFRREKSNRFRDWLMKLTEIEFRITTDWHYRLGEFYDQYAGM